MAVVLKVFYKWGLLLSCKNNPHLFFVFLSLIGDLLKCFLNIIFS